MSSGGTGTGTGPGVGGGASTSPRNPDGVRGSCGRRITFDNVGGLDEHVKVLKEILLLPLMYKEVYARFSIKPPRGVLFYGPPGTGKTLVAGALANECSRGDRRVSFLSRKGADCYSKYVGESEQRLRAIFEEARQQQPAIIFFDEIDGLAPTRSSRHDIVHASVVSTLLALMDGLDTASNVIVIGATNRIDAIDPALRRPGRFDRELYFPLPSVLGREQILNVHLRHWRRPPSDAFIQQLAANTVGYCGSDLQALCSEAVLCGLRRLYPDIYISTTKQKINFTALSIEEQDFACARRKIIAASKRSMSSPVKRLTPFIRPLFEATYSKIVRQLEQRYAFTSLPINNIDRWYAYFADWRDQMDDASSLPCPCLLLVGHPDQGHTTHLGPALLHHLEHLPTTVLDIAALFEHSGRVTEEACISRIKQACQHIPGVLYLPDITSWWHLVDEATRAVFISLINRLDATMPILLLGTVHVPYEELPAPLQKLWRDSDGQVFTLMNPTDKEREAFFKPLITERSLRPPPKRPCPDQMSMSQNEPATMEQKDVQSNTDNLSSENRGHFSNEDFSDCSSRCSDSDGHSDLVSEDGDADGEESVISSPIKRTRGLRRSKRVLKSNARRRRDGRRSPVQTRARSKAASRNSESVRFQRNQTQFDLPIKSRSRSRSPIHRASILQRSKSVVSRSSRQSDGNELLSCTFVEDEGSVASSPGSEAPSSEQEMSTEVEAEIGISDLKAGRPSSFGLLIDSEALTAILHRAVRITADQPTRILEALHAALLNAIAPFESRVDRRGLPKVLSAALDKFEKNILKLQNQNRPDGIKRNSAPDDLISAEQQETME